MQLLFGAGAPEQHDPDGNQHDGDRGPRGADQRTEDDSEPRAKRPSYIGPETACRHQAGEDEAHGDDIGAMSGPNRGHGLLQPTIGRGTGFGFGLCAGLRGGFASGFRSHNNNKRTIDNTSNQ